MAEKKELCRQTLEAIELVEKYGVQRVDLEYFPLGPGNNRIWKPITANNVSWTAEAYRAKLRPEPKQFPLCPEDIPPGSVVRLKTVIPYDPGIFYGVGGVFSDSVTIICCEYLTQITYLELMEWEMLLPGKSEWTPCYKLEN